MYLSKPYIFTWVMYLILYNLAILYILYVGTGCHTVICAISYHLDFIEIQSLLLKLSKLQNLIYSL